MFLKTKDRKKTENRSDIGKKRKKFHALATKICIKTGKIEFAYVEVMVKESLYQWKRMK